MIPVADSLLYIQPLYVESSRNAFPELQQVIAVYGNHPAAIGPTAVRRHCTQVFQAPVSTTTGVPGTTGTLSPQVRALLDQAQAAYQQSQTDLKAGNLGAYQIRHQHPRVRPSRGPAADRRTTADHVATTHDTSPTSTTPQRRTARPRQGIDREQGPPQRTAISPAPGRL